MGNQAIDSPAKTEEVTTTSSTYANSSDGYIPANTQEKDKTTMEWLTRERMLRLGALLLFTVIIASISRSPGWAFIQLWSFFMLIIIGMIVLQKYKPTWYDRVMDEIYARSIW